MHSNTKGPALLLQILNLSCSFGWRRWLNRLRMLYKTRGIVFKTTDYSETSVIVQVFTEKFGLQSYLINGVKRPKAKIRQNMLQPLHLLDMVVYHKTTANIQRVSELRQTPVFHTLPYDTVKSSVVLFLNEVLYKSVRQQGADEVLFDYIYHAVVLFDGLSSGITNFHLCFLLRLTQFLGFYPDNTKAGAPYFDLKNGVYCSVRPTHLLVLEEPFTSYWTRLSGCSFEQSDAIKMPGSDRKIMLGKLLEYYRLHVDNFGEIKSLRILEEVLS